MYFMSISVNVNVGCIHCNDGISNPFGRTPVIVFIIEEIVLLHETEYLLPVDYISGFLEVFADLLVAIAYKLSSQKFLYNRKDMYQES